MSVRSRSLPRRSVLSVPGSSQRFLSKAPQVPADMIMFDLEDAVASSEKAMARELVVDAVHSLEWSDQVLCVRVNDWSTPFTFRDVADVVGRAGERLDTVMLPKVQNAGDVIALDRLLSQVERENGLTEGHIGIEVLIETATALLNAGEICGASPRLEAAVLGPADLAASLEMPILTGGSSLAGYPGDHFHFVLMTILTAARAHGLQAIDGPYFRIEDTDGLREMADRSRLLGFDGKWAIHPTQVDVLNDVFKPTAEQIARATAIIAALDGAADVEGKGALRDGDEMLDEANRKVADKILARAARTGGRVTS